MELNCSLREAVIYISKKNTLNPDSQDNLYSRVTALSEQFTRFQRDYASDMENIERSNLGEGMRRLLADMTSRLNNTEKKLNDLETRLSKLEEG